MDTSSFNKQITYSSIQSSNNSAISPTIGSNSPILNPNKFSYSDKPQGQQQNYNNQRSFYKANSFRHSNQSPNVTGDNNNGNNFRFQNQRFQPNPQQQQQQQNSGVSLYIKANNVTEELLRSIFTANVSQAKLLSIDVKNK